MTGVAGYLRARREGGSAIAEFAMVSALVTVLSLAVLQVGLALYVRNVLIACASEGARLAAREDAGTHDGVDRTRDLIGASLSAHFAERVTVAVTDEGGLRVVTVRVVAPLPVMGLLGLDGRVEVVGRAFAERQ
jgi:Flp pilus assembly protein TadG